MLVTTIFSIPFLATYSKVFFLRIDKSWDNVVRVNPLPNKPWFSLVCSTSHWKTQWEKEKLLVTSNFSFSHSVFYPFRELSANFIKLKIVVCKLFQFGRVQSLSFGKGLNRLYILTLSQTTNFRLFQTKTVCRQQFQI